MDQLQDFFAYCSHIHTSANAQVNTQNICIGDFSIEQDN